MADFLHGKVALITGASRGLGRVMAQALAGEGCRLALVGRDMAMLDESAALCRAAGAAGVAVFRADVTRESDVLSLDTQVRAALPPVQILINNAGMNIRRPLVDFTLDEWRQVLDTNLTSAFLMCRSFVPHMRGTGYGRVLNLSSIMSHISLPGRSAYSASKAALLGLTRALALEVAGEGITVVGISPGPFATDMNTSLLEDEELNRDFTSRIPVGHWGRPEDLGRLVVYLCSAEASFITGSDVVIDGGWLAQ